MLRSETNDGSLHDAMGPTCCRLSTHPLSLCSSFIWMSKVINISWVILAFQFPSRIIKHQFRANFSWKCLFAVWMVLSCVVYSCGGLVTRGWSSQNILQGLHTDSIRRSGPCLLHSLNVLMLTLDSNHLFTSEQQLSWQNFGLKVSIYVPVRGRL